MMSINVFPQNLSNKIRFFEIDTLNCHPATCHFTTKTRTDPSS